MTTPTPHGAPELPAACPFCDHSIMHMRSVGKMQQAHCSGCGAAGPLFTDAGPAIAAWNRRAAIQQAAGAVPEMISVGHQYLFPDPFGGEMWLNSPDEWNGHRPQGSREIFAASPSPLGREAGSSDHLVPCAGGGVTQWQPIETAPKTSKAILVHCADRKNTYTATWARDEEFPWSGKWKHFAGGFIEEVPTHWQPSPSPPAPRPDAPTSQIKKAPTDQSGYHDPARIAAWNAANPDVNHGSAPREDGHGS